MNHRDTEAQRKTKNATSHQDFLALPTQCNGRASRQLSGLVNGSEFSLQFLLCAFVSLWLT
jgi:hypothetical protein